MKKLLTLLAALGLIVGTGGMVGCDDAADNVEDAAEEAGEAAEDAGEDLDD